MPTQINGTTGVDKHQDGSVTQEDLAANVAGNGPAFIAYRSTTPQSITISPVTMVCDVEELDTANAYNTATGVFTAPIAGLYCFTAYAYFASSSYITKLTFIKNGVTYARPDNRSVPSGNCQGSVYVKLAVGDTVSVALTSDTTQNTFVADSTYSRFSGCLVRAA